MSLWLKKQNLEDNWLTMNIVIFGPPGAGKGTQSKLIVKKFKLFQLSTGELLRKEIKDSYEAIVFFKNVFWDELFKFNVL